MITVPRNPYHVRVQSRSSSPESYSSISQMGDYGDMDSFKSTLSLSQSRSSFLIIMIIICLTPLSYQECYRSECDERTDSNSCQSNSIRDTCNKKGRIVINSNYYAQDDPTDDEATQWQATEMKKLFVDKRLCLTYEMHEHFESKPSQSSDSIQTMCGGNGDIFNFTVQNFQSAPYIFNVTLQCCAPTYCMSDHDCPVNFNCESGYCESVECESTNDLVVMSQEGKECLIVDDCFFYIPDDADNWKCIPDPRCSYSKTCADSNKFCKRCPTGLIYADGYV